MSEYELGFYFAERQNAWKNITVVEHFLDYTHSEKGQKRWRYIGCSGEYWEEEILKFMKILEPIKMK